MSEAQVRAAFRDQVDACRTLGSPLTADLCAALAEHLQADQGNVAALVLGWAGDPGPRAGAVPLRLCGALHALVLGGHDPELAADYAARRVDPARLIATLSRHEDFILHWLEGPPQTNEVARAAALIGAARFIATRHQLPFRLLELGASAGLNLNFGRFRLAPNSPDNAAADEVVLSPDWQGDLPLTPFTVVEAEGVDLRPLDPARDADRLMAYCWADQTARMARLDSALALARRHPNPVEAGDAAAWLSRQLSQPAAGRVTMVYHTIAWQYFPPATQASCEDSLQAAGRASTPHAPLAHVAMEGDGGKGGDGAALTLRLWDGDLRQWALGRVDFHGRWIRWDPTPL